MKTHIPSLDGRRALFVGDSITDAGTYVSQVLHLLGGLRPAWRIGKIASVGLSSETLSGLSEPKHPFPRPCLHERLDRALAKFKPEILFSCYGMNDGIYNPQSPKRMKAYQDGVEKLLSKAYAAGVEHAVLMTPPPFDPKPVADKVLPASAPEEEFSYMNPFEGYYSVMEGYAKWLMELKRPKLTVIDLNSALKTSLREGLKFDSSFCLSPDGIHPNFFGHLLIALEILKALGVESGKSPQELCAELEASPSFKAADERRKALSEAWRAYIGYTRESAVRRDSIDDVLKSCAWG